MKNRIMALPISTIPVLTGEVAEEFERQAQETYNAVINRTEAQKKEASLRYEQGMKMVREVLAKSKLAKLSLVL